MKTTNNKSGLIGTAVVLVILLAACIAVDAALPSYHIAITVIKKATVYSLVAVSMNLLNGFTGLFSLGQAGFMMLGAYSYAILTIPVAKRAGVYQYFDGGWVQFSLPERDEPYILSIFLNGKEVIESREIVPGTSSFVCDLTGTGTQTYDIYIDGEYYQSKEVPFN